MNEKVSVTVNGNKTTFFLGLTVRHAIGARAVRSVQKGRAEVRNADGNIVGLDGALYNGETLIVRDLDAAIDVSPALAPEPAAPERAPASPQQMRSRRQWMQESLLGDESLRSGLIDDEAHALLNWGMAHLDAWVQASTVTADEQQARAELRVHLRRVSAIMRGISRFAVNKQNLDTQAATTELVALFVPSGGSPDRSPAQREYVALAEQKDSLSSADLVCRLVAIANRTLPHPGGDLAATPDHQVGAAGQGSAWAAAAQPGQKKGWFDSVRSLFGR